MVPYCSCCLYLYFGSSIMLVTYFVNFRKLNDHLFGKELFILFTASAFRKLPSIYVFSYFPFGFEGRMWDLIVSVPDHCLYFYFTSLSESEKLQTIPDCSAFLATTTSTVKRKCNMQNMSKLEYHSRRLLYNLYSTRY